MRFSRRIPTVLVGLFLLVCSSCTPGGETTDSSSSEGESSEVTVATTEETSVATTDSDAVTESAAPLIQINYIDVRVDVVDFLRDEKRFELEYESVFLRIDEVGQVVDANVLDGITVGPAAEEVSLPVGTILFPVNDQLEILSPEQPTTLFVLLDDLFWVFYGG